MGFLVVFQILLKILSIDIYFICLKSYSIMFLMILRKLHVQEKSGSPTMFPTIWESGKSAKIVTFFKVAISPEQMVQIEIHMDFQKDKR